jgi:hypothetical protein
MALTKVFRETVHQRAQRDGAFRKALLTEAVNAYLGGEPLAAELGKPAKSLHRMLGPGGNPSTANILDPA